jgi:hypothetical protein
MSYQELLALNNLSRHSHIGILTEYEPGVRIMVTTLSPSICQITGMKWTPSLHLLSASLVRL